MTDASRTPKRKRHWLRYSLRTMLVVVVLLCATLALWEQNRHLQNANSVLEAHGLTWNLEPPSKDTYRVLVNEVVSDSDAVVKQVTIDTLGKPDIALIGNDGKRYPIRDVMQTAAQPLTSGVANRSRLSIVATTSHHREKGTQFRKSSVSLRFGPVRSTFKVGLSAEMPAHQFLTDVVKFKILPGEYVRGSAIDLLDFLDENGEPHGIQIIVD